MSRRRCAGAEHLAGARRLPPATPAPDRIAAPPAACSLPPGADAGGGHSPVPRVRAAGRAGDVWSLRSRCHPAVVDPSRGNARAGSDRLPRVDSRAASRLARRDPRRGGPQRLLVPPRDPMADRPRAIDPRAGCRSERHSAHRFARPLRAGAAGSGADEVAGGAGAGAAVPAPTPAQTSSRANPGGNRHDHTSIHRVIHRRRARGRADRRRGCSIVSAAGASAGARRRPYSDREGRRTPAARVDARVPAPRRRAAGRRGSDAGSDAQRSRGSSRCARLEWSRGAPQGGAGISPGMALFAVRAAVDQHDRDAAVPSSPRERRVQRSLLRDRRPQR